MSTEPSGWTYARLPEPNNSDGEQRRVGLEYEFGGLTAAEAAAVVSDWAGAKAVSSNPHAFRVETERYGAFEIYLDMAATHPPGAETSGVEAAMRKTIGDTAQVVVPVEIVCPPIPADEIKALDELTDALGQAGARGTDRSLFYAFGMHFNVEAEALTVEAIAPVLSAYVLIEPWLREELALDLTRRTFSFVDPFPRAYIDAVAEPGFGTDIDALIAGYLRENPTRNRSLDMTPLLAMIDRETVEHALGGEKLKPRPTFHYRLPDCLIGTEGWTSARDWAAWVHVERVSRDDDLLRSLAAGWREHRDHWFTNRADWVRDIAGILGAHQMADWRGTASLGASQERISA